MPWSALQALFGRHTPHHAPDETKSSSQVQSADVIMAFLFDQVSDKKLTEELHASYKKAQALPQDKREQAYIPLYIALEEIVTKSAPPAVKTAYTIVSLRDEIRHHQQIQALSPEFRLLFLPESNQAAQLFLLGLKDTVTYFIQNLGTKKLEELLKRLADAKAALPPLEVTEYGFKLIEDTVSKLSVSELADEFRQLFDVLYHELIPAFGKDVVDQSVDQSYEFIKNSYDHALISRFLEIVPEGVLDREKITFLSREELQKQVAERSEEVQKAKEELEGKIADLNNNKQAMLNLLEDARQLEEELKKEKEGVERKVEERTRELHEQQAKLMASINALGRGYVMTDVQGTILLTNTTVDRMFGPAANGKWTIDGLQERIGTTISLFDTFHKCIDKKETLDISDVSFGNRTLRVIVIPILSDDQKAGVLGTLMLFEDITERRILERSREEFFSIASHELRTPLTAIRGNTSMIQDFFGDQLKDPQFKEMIDDIHESSVRLISIVNDFLDMSRLEQGKIEFNKESVDIAELIRDVLKEYQTTGSQKKLSLTFEEPKQPLPRVMADKDRVKQILINLVGNGLKFTQEGGVTVRLYLHNGFVRVIVEDTGRGIPYENQVLLFRKFQQAGDSLFTRDTTKGTGLGLYISKLMIEGMGGAIGLEYSQPGKGSAFAFSLPIEEAGAAVSPSPSS